MKIISKPVQFARLRKAYPSSHGEIAGNNFVWYHELRPTPISPLYKIKITCVDKDKHGNYTPRIYIRNPKPLRLAKGESKLPHVYSTKEQQICLYDWRCREWNCSMAISDTIVPWTAEWLYFYEVWAATGEWLGEGHHPDNNKKKEK